MSDYASSDGTRRKVTGDINDVERVYRLLDRLRQDLMTELAKLDTKFETEMKVHQQQHTQEKDYRSQLYRWAVTTILTGTGVLVALWAALTNPLGN